jgi:ferric-dicitrate binding protein FerR (iron transport regulator)
MTSSEIPTHENALSEKEAFDLTAHVKEASDKGGKEFEDCLNMLLRSRKKLARVIEDLRFEEEVILALTSREDSEQRERDAARAAAASLGEADGGLSTPLSAVPHPWATRPIQGRRSSRTVRYSVVAASVVIPLAAAAGAAVSYFHESRPIEPTPMGERVELSDSSIVTTDPFTRARVNFTWLARDVDLSSGGAKFDVDGSGRPFNVITDPVTATAHGTRFYVRLEGPADNLRTLVEVLQGEVLVKSRAMSPPESWTLVANEQGRFASNGRIEIRKIPTGTQAMATLPKVRNVPLATLAMRVNRTGRGPRIVVEGGACSYPMNGSFDLEDPTSVIDHVQADPNLITHGVEVIVVRLAADSSLTQDAAQKECSAELDDSSVVSSGTRGAPGTESSEESTDPGVVP